MEFDNSGHFEQRGTYYTLIFYSQSFTHAKCSSLRLVPSRKSHPFRGGKLPAGPRSTGPKIMKNGKPPNSWILETLESESIPATVDRPDKCTGQGRRGSSRTSLQVEASLRKKTSRSPRTSATTTSWALMVRRTALSEFWGFSANLTN